MTKNKRYTKNIVKSIRIDAETSEYIAYLSKMGVSWQQLIHSEIKEILKQKAIDFKLKIKQEKTPF